MDESIASAERRVAFVTARESVARAQGGVAWLCQGLLPAGALVELTGKVKVAGKTTFMLALCRALVAGRPFLDLPTTATPVVYLTEQAERSFTAALRRADLAERADFHILYWRETVGVPWPAVVQQAAAHAARVGARLVVVDTFSQFAGLHGDMENNAGSALEALQPLQLAVGDGVTAVLVRHERKAGGDISDAARGTTAIAGAMDTLLKLGRGDGTTKPTVCVLSTVSRFDDTPPLLTLDLTEAGYCRIDPQDSQQGNHNVQRILAELPTDPACAVSVSDLVGRLGLARTTLDNHLRWLLDQRLCQRTGTGGRGDAFRFWRAGEGDD